MGDNNNHIDGIEANIRHDGVRLLIYENGDYVHYDMNGDGDSLMRMLYGLMLSSSDIVDVIRGALMAYDREINPRLLDFGELN